jgi:sugar phosphate isomerase/epimerase
MFKNLNPAALGVSGHQSEIIELALTYGFRGIDDNVVEMAGRLKLHGLKYARRLIDSAGLRIGSFPLPLELDAADDAFAAGLEKLANYAAVAAEFGCTRCLATLAPASATRPYHENFEFHRRRLAEVCRALEPSGVRLGVGFRAAESLRKGQNFQFIHDLDALSLLLNMAGAANLGMVVDTWDLVVAGGSVDSLRGLPVKQIIAVQLADLPPEGRTPEMTEQSRRIPAEGGQIDFAAVLSVLAELGYDGPVTPLPDRKFFDGVRRDLIVRQLGEGLDKPWRAAGLAAGGRPSLAGR